MTDVVAGPDTATMVAIYESAIKTRKCEERVRSLVMSGEIMLIIHVPWGQEVIGAAMGAALRADDYVVTTYRAMQDQIGRGVPLKALWAEYLGRSTGPCKGKGGPMHIAYPEKGLMVSTGIVGGGLPIANGLALSSQLKGDGKVTVCNFGDGASNIGAFHESLNLAALWDLPVVFLCQNNLFGEHTHVSDHQRNAHVADRAAGYGMHGETVDGRDPVAMWSAATRAIDRARRGDGPTLLEAVAPRMGGHYVGDAAEYMPDGWIADATANDPVLAMRADLIGSGAAAEDQLAALEQQIEGELDEAVEFAMNSPFPDLEELRRDVFAEETH